MEDFIEETGQLKGVVIDPDLYLKVINHDLRKQILNRLFVLSLEKPISKSTIADYKVGACKSGKACTQ